MLDEFHIGLLAALQTPAFKPRAARAALLSPARFANLTVAEVIETLLSLRPGEGGQYATAAMRLVHGSGARDIRTLSLNDHEYPQPLRELTDAPPFIFALGELPTDWSQAVAVIGTREPDSVALQATRQTVQAAPSEAVIVSGLAMGVDTVAHTAALDAGRATVAVLAHGLDMVYPKQNQELAQRIVSDGGCLLSEYPVGIGMQQWQLVARDRLQSALSRAVFLMQTSVDGGSMHTAAFARRQGRLLVALRASTDAPSWSGNRLLLHGGPSNDKRFPDTGPHAVGMAPSSIPAFVRAAFGADFVLKSQRTTSEAPQLPLI